MSVDIDDNEDNYYRSYSVSIFFVLDNVCFENSVLFKF